MDQTSDPADLGDFVQELAGCQSDLRAYILAALGNYANTEDVLQKTNLTLWKKASDYQPGTRFVSWAITVARFEVMRFLRDSRRDRHVFANDVAELLLSSAEREMEDGAGRRDALRKCLTKLPPKHRSLLWERYDEGKTIREIAEDTEKSVDAVKSLFLRIRRSLEHCIRAAQRSDAV